jgi:hypothetical protein
METTNLQWAIYLLKFALFIFSIGFVALMYWFIRSQYRIWKQNKRNCENEFEIKYLWLEERIRNCYHLDKNNYNYFKDQLLQLAKMKYCNWDKIDTLTASFYRKFKNIAKKELSENL